MDGSAKRAAVLVARVWIEAGTGGLRGRLTSTLDLERPDEVTTLVSSPAQVCDAVRAWLEAFMAASAPTPRKGSSQQQ